MNKVTLLGRVGVEPEIKNVGDYQVVNFTIATRKNADAVDWHKVTAWNKTCEIVQKYVNKGDLIAVEGRLETVSYEKNDVTHFVTKVIANSVHLIGSGKKSVKSSQDDFNF